MAKFKVRARTLDLLGRQQIAGIPTAISELFKNAHDAYANNVTVDYFRDDGLFLLRDDGLGMTREDFENRWLTLGTESKLESDAGIEAPAKDPNQEERPVLGEKGIGRLAIAVIGPQVLVLTRAKREGTPQQTITAAYLHWDLFELPGIDLEQISIPIREFSADKIPDAQDIADMVKEAIAGAKTLIPSTSKVRVDTIIADMKTFEVDPQDIDEFTDAPSLNGGGCGTFFYIKPADEILNDDIDNRTADDVSTRFERNLLGFSNTMKTAANDKPTDETSTESRKTPKSPFVTKILDHRDEGDPVELVGPNAFFTPNEFDMADHHIHGRFDEYGQFIGSVGVYQMDPDPYVLSWNEGNGKPTLCGPFEFHIAIVQGSPKDSLIEASKFASVTRKVDRHGGVYIYRDGIRIQPYGGPDYDFLDIERNRTKKADFYYYSFRRMFGYVELSRRDNHNLIEKAGREGFRENKAYRQFVSILKNFFLNSAGDFFRRDGLKADKWEEQRAELNRLYKAQQKREQNISTKKRKFIKELDGFFEFTANHDVPLQAEKIVMEAVSNSQEVLYQDIPDTEKSAKIILEEKTARNNFDTIRDKIKISKPKGIGFSAKINNEWSDYKNKYTQSLEVLKKAETELEEKITTLSGDAGLRLNAVLRLDDVITSRTESFMKSFRSIDNDNKKTLAAINSNAREELSNLRILAKNKSEEILSDLNRVKGDISTESDVSKLRQDFEDRLAELSDEVMPKINNLRDQLMETIKYWDTEGYSTTDITEAMESELEALKESRHNDIELIQLGMATRVLSHEFHATIIALRRGFQRLKSWADINPDFTNLYSQLRSNFEALDTYLNLFTPFDRRLQRKSVDIKCNDIFEFLHSVFETRLEKGNITLTATKSFSKKTIHGFPSDFYPAFVNLVDNAIFWVASVSNRNKLIELDIDAEDIVVRDYGPGISLRDQSNVFELNFSRKPGGRGMGLYISKETLKNAGYDLTLDESTDDTGAVFRISPNKDQD